MTWTATNFLIEFIAGMVCGHVAAVAARDYSFGMLGHFVVGAIGGGLGGYFLKTSIVVNESRLFEQIMAHSLTGASAGAISVLTVGFIKHSIHRH
jgi:uncharacterized membrane protein YeaQ/YmgE (transglycosylase-associated protein family)